MYLFIYFLREKESKKHYLFFVLNIASKIHQQQQHHAHYIHHSHFQQDVGLPHYKGQPGGQDHQRPHGLPDQREVHHHQPHAALAAAAQAKGQ